jgi:hypothetical protein
MTSYNLEEGERAYDAKSSLVQWPALTTGQDAGWIPIVARYIAQSMAKIPWDHPHSIVEDTPLDIFWSTSAHVYDTNADPWIYMLRCWSQWGNGEDNQTWDSYFKRRIPASRVVESGLVSILVDLMLYATHTNTRGSCRLRTMRCWPGQNYRMLNQFPAPWASADVSAKLQRHTREQVICSQGR